MSAESTIVRAAIHPAIGIARVGNSREPGHAGFFVGPEVSDQAALPLGEYKDCTGALRRQAARFRIYGYNAAGEAVAELTPENAEIQWTVHLANTKAAWYNFELALDIPEAAAAGAVQSTRRNALIQGADRKRLAIDPGARSIRGKSASGAQYHFDSGRFFDLKVGLGELQTDAHGHLLVLGGFGVSQSVVGQPPQTFANNDGWHDDVADGPVDAKVTLGGREIPVDGAWVSVGPPNYAPALKTVRTMYDLLFDRMVAWGLLTAPTVVSFQRDIRPIFERLTGLQWVNQGFASFFGAGTAFDAAPLLPRLADASPGNREYRERVFAQFRNPATSGQQLGKLLWPQFYGDALDSLTTPTAQNPDPSLAVPRGLASLTTLQLTRLKKWTAGEFTNDLDLHAKPPASLDEVALKDRPQALTEAALSHCLADAFHPGCELTWPMRIRSLYSTPFRIRRRSTALPEPDFGDVLTPAKALSAIGPLNGAAAGDLTRWMAVPWQTDTASCLSGYTFFGTSPSLPTFWPARVPNQVLREADYEVVIDTKKSNSERLAAFYRREDWFRVFGGNSNSDIAQMITEFDKLGIVESRPGPTDLASIPNEVLVESKPALPDPIPAPAAAHAAAAAHAPAAAPAAAAPTDATLPARYRLRKFGKHRAE
jgi:hypothetical protein